MVNWASKREICPLLRFHHDIDIGKSDTLPIYGNPELGDTLRARYRKATLYVPGE